MTLLFRKILLDSLRFVGSILAVGIIIYLLIDIFERLDNFLEVAAPASLILTYFLVKIPLVISQLLPVIFLLAVVVQLSLMARNRELIALQASGISFWHVLKAILIVSSLWALVQLSFSEWLGVKGEQASVRIWEEQVRKRNVSNVKLDNVWFAEGNWVVHLKELRADDSGDGFVGYQLSEDGLQVRSLIRAERFKAEVGNWLLEDLVKHNPQSYERKEHSLLSLPFQQDPETFRLVIPGTKPGQLSLEQLDGAIDQLKKAGSNVERLRAAWHMKLAYAASLVVMALMGTVLVMWKSSIMVAIPLSLASTLIYYALFTLGNSLGERGFLSAITGAWLANVIMASLALLFFMYNTTKHRRQ